MRRKINDHCKSNGTIKTTTITITTTTFIFLYINSFSFSFPRPPTGTFSQDVGAFDIYFTDLPQGIPEVIVEKQRYAIGETVKANCTTPPSNPTANVTWSVNGLLV